MMLRPNKILAANLKLELDNQLLKQRIAYFEFEIRNLEKKSRDPTEDQKDKLKRRIQGLNEIAMRKFALKVQEELPHFVDKTSNQLNIELETITMKDYKALNKVISTVIKNEKVRMRYKSKSEAKAL